MAPLALGAGWLLGSYAAGWFGISPEVAIAIAALLLVGALVGRRTSERVALPLVLLFFAASCGGYGRAMTAAPSPSTLASLYGVRVEATGTILDEPERRGTTKTFHFRIDDLRIATGDSTGDWITVGADVLVRTDPFRDLHHGDVLIVRGRLDEPWQPDNVIYRTQLERRGVFAEVAFPDLEIVAASGAETWRAALFWLRNTLAAALAGALPEPSAALAQGILLGMRGSLPRDLNDAFARTGTTHLIAISGFNISLVIGFVRPLGARLFPRREWLVAIAAIAAYVALVGPQPSVVRAAIMGSLAVMARALGRPADALAWLALAAAAMAAVAPYLIHDLGFQLSFLATLGLIVLADPIQRRLLFLGTWLSQQVATTIAAECWVLPLLVQTFGVVSIVTLGANVLAAELVAPSMALSAATAALGALWPPLGEVSGWFAWVVLSAFIYIVVGFGSIPFAALPVGRIPDAVVGALYLGLAGLVLLRPDLPFRRPLAPLALRIWTNVSHAVNRVPTVPLIGGLTLVTVVVWSGAVCAPAPSGVRLTMLDLGRGEALLLQTQDGRNVLVDGGGDGSALVNALDRRLPFWRREIDLAILTAPKDDRLPGLVDLAERNRLRQVLQPAFDASTPARERWGALLAERQIPVTEAAHGQEVRVGDDLRLYVLMPERATEPGASDESIVLRLVVGETEALLLGDVDAASQARLAASTSGAALITIPRDGRRGALSSGLLSAAKPEVALITVAARQGQRYPDAETLDQLSSVAVYRTDRHGSIEIDFVADGYRIRTQRGAGP